MTLTALHTYLIRNIPQHVWVRAKARAKRERRTLRAVLIRLLRDYGAGQ